MQKDWIKTSAEANIKKKKWKKNHTYKDLQMSAITAPPISKPHISTFPYNKEQVLLLFTSRTPEASRFQINQGTIYFFVTTSMI